ncbi:MAG: hypothetical protein GEV28_00445 [Actinophytocola sp.]|uniref:hypothetical protein n=1 Tax=Actinophytocola sp. TaxID=1872138 RepID=UPI001328AA03|nr:hypothetical protein [Actinophytocola sp.]MPZ78939.1 hypothetical protein [Actinophytocola sp.]
MEFESTTPAEAAEIRKRWARSPQESFDELARGLTEYGVDMYNVSWMSAEDSEVAIRHWRALGAEKYGRLTLVPPEGSNVRRGEFSDGTVPPWLAQDRCSQRVLVSFSAAMPVGLLAICEWGFVVDNLSQLARADGDGYAVAKSDLQGVVLVNIDDDLGDKAFLVDAWGDFVLNVDDGQ